MCNFPSYIFPTPVIKTVEVNAKMKPVSPWVTGWLRWAMHNNDIYHEQEKNLKFTKPMRFWDYLLLQHNLGSPDWYKCRFVFIGVLLKNCSLHCYWTQYDSLWEKVFWKQRPRKSFASLEELACFLLTDNENYASGQIFCFWLPRITETNQWLNDRDCDLFLILFFSTLSSRKYWPLIFSSLCHTILMNPIRHFTPFVEWGKMHIWLKPRFNNVIWAEH